MARILFTTWEGGGHVMPLMLVAKGLMARGHEALAISDACNAGEAAAAGVPFRSWRKAPNRPNKLPETDVLRDWEVTSPADSVQRVCERVIVGPAADYAADVMEALAEGRFDLVVTEELLFGVLMGAEAAGVKSAIFASNLWCFPTIPGLPAFGAGFPPAKSEADHLRDQMVNGIARQFYDLELTTYNQAREALGLAPLATLMDQLKTPRSILIGVSAAFDFTPDPMPEPYRHVGPYLQDPYWTKDWVSPWPDDAREPLVLVSYSTMYQNQEAALQHMIDALEGLPIRALVTLGPVLDPTLFHGNATAVVMQSAPHSLLFKDAAAFVSHGGHASVIRPMMAGVPVVVAPMSRDNFDNAARATERGAGLALSPFSPPETIRTAVMRVVTEPSFREAAKALGDRISADLANRSAEDEIEAVLAG